MRLYKSIIVAGALLAQICAGASGPLWTTMPLSIGQQVPVGGGGGGSGALTNAFIQSVSLGTLRNDFSGNVGFKFTVGTSPIVLTSVGRWIIAGNTADKSIAIRYTNSTLLVAVNLKTAGQTAGAFAYTNGATVGSLPLTLSSNTSYYIESTETSGGDSWYNNNTTVTTQPDAVLNDSAFSETAGGSGVNTTFGPVDFTYHL